MVLVQPQNVKTDKQNNVNIPLEEILRPLWKLTYYSGILLDWCRPISNSNRLSEVAQYVCISLSFSLVFLLMLFETVQLILLIGMESNIHTIIPNLIWFTPILLAFLVYGHCLREQRYFLNFFNDWSKLEEAFTKSDVTYTMCRSKRVHLMMYAAYVFMIFGSLISIGFSLQTSPEASYLISTYKAVREIIPLFFCFFLHLISIWLTWILLSFGDIVPAFIYYHAALAVNCLENDIRTAFAKRNSANCEGVCASPLLPTRKFNETLYLNTNRSSAPSQNVEDAIRLMWTRFEDINQLVGRANFLFGRLMFYNQGWLVFMITLLLYSILYKLKDALETQSADMILPYCLNVLAFIFRLISCTLISSQLHKSVSKLHTFLNYLLSHHWGTVSKDERELLRSFQTRLQSDHLVTSPLGLYHVTPTTLLTVLGLVVSYVIVLIQSK